MFYIYSCAGDREKKDNSEDNYLAIASMKGSIIHALKLSTIAFIKKNT